MRYKWEDFNIDVIDDLFGDQSRTRGLEWSFTDQALLQGSCNKLHQVNDEKDIDEIVSKCLTESVVKSVGFCGNKIRQKLGLSPLQPRMTREGVPIKVNNQGYPKRIFYMPDAVYNVNIKSVYIYLNSYRFPIGKGRLCFFITYSFFFIYFTVFILIKKF